MEKELKKTTSSTKKQTGTTKTKKSTAKLQTKTTTVKNSSSKGSGTKKASQPRKNSQSASKNIEKKEPIKVETKETQTQTQEKKPANDMQITSINNVTIITIVIAAILITMFLAKTFGQSTPKDITKSYLLTNKIVQTELDSTNIESIFQKEKSFVFVTTLNNEDEYELESNLRELIEKNNLKDDFYIFDVNKNNSIDLNTSLKLEGRQLRTPTILYYKNGILIDTVTREDEKMIEAGDFQKLLDSYELTE